MPKRLTVFYSWQSDTPSSLNRSFIEKAVREALERLHSDASLELALRGTPLELDKDTQGVAGSPPIAETILNKISECSVFVADLTFVGETTKALASPAEPPRRFPNPNVLIEYGYALKCHGHNALISIMNSAFGEPDASTLPFDLRHLRWPITYQLPNANDPTKDAQFQKLAAVLAEAIGLVIAQKPPPAPAVPFTPQTPTKSAAVFFTDASTLVPEGPLGHLNVTKVPDEGQLFLRLHPTFAIPTIQTELEATILVRQGALRPMGDVSGYSVARNSFGAIVYEAPKDGNLYNFTQLFLNRELWGVDAFVISAPGCRAYTAGKSNGFLPTSGVEENFAETLQNYLACAKNLNLLPPLRLQAGMVGIKGYQLGVPNGLVGEALQDSIVWEAEVLDPDTPAHQLLAPFFDLIWAKFGLERPSSRQQELASRFR
jgi:hypothetical protein